MFFYSAETFQKGLFITGVGVFTVFFVLLIIAFIVSLFRFIPEENHLRPVEKSLPLLPKTLKSTVKLSPLHQAVVIASILEDVNVSSSRQIVKINKIIQLSD